MHSVKNTTELPVHVKFTFHADGQINIPAPFTLTAHLVLVLPIAQAPCLTISAPVVLTALQTDCHLRGIVPHKYLFHSCQR